MKDIGGKKQFNETHYNLNLVLVWFRIQRMEHTDQNILAGIWLRYLIEMG
jgi:hypothetical protein